jgi:two-component system OmpR family response regulator
MEHANEAPGAPAILVIDDEVDLLDLFAKRLARAGFDVSTAATGAEAIALLDAREFRVVICDIHMPDGVSGFDVLAHVRGAGRAPVGFLFVTGHGEGTPEMELAQSMGVDGVYVKPIPSKVLIAHLRQLCGLPELVVPPVAT